MNREELSKCQTLEECVNEIWRQNYVRDSREDIGCYLKANTKMKNSHFDILFAYAEKIFIDVTKEDEPKDGMLMMYNILKKWLGRELKFKYIPKDVPELIALLYDLEKSKETCKYLCGVLDRMTKNLLYASKDKNSYSQKVYCTSNEGAKDYTNVNMFELDKSYNLNNNGEEVNGYDIFEAERYKNGIYNEKYEEENIYRFIYNNVCTDRDREEIEKKVDMGSSYKCGVRANALIKRIEKSNYNNIEVKDGKLVSGGDYLQFGRKLMESNDLIEKFEMIKRAINSRSKVGEIVLDLIIDLDVKIYRQFFQHLKDNRYVKWYVRSDNFREILDVLLDEYSMQQKRLKDIYCYNESQRRDKLRLIKEMFSKCCDDNNIIDKNDFTRIYNELVKMFKIDRYIGKEELRKVNTKIRLMNELGFNVERLSNGKYRLLQSIAYI